jgi:hypothetical protein
MRGAVDFVSQTLRIAANPDIIEEWPKKFKKRRV